MDDLDRTFMSIAIAGFLFGALIALGLPWIWAELLKPFLQWLVL